MKVVIFGATGMVGQGVLRECVLAPDVTEVVAVGRSRSGQAHRKLRHVVRPDLTDLTPVATDLAGTDAVFFCLGVASTGMPEAEYRRITYELTVSVARFFADAAGTTAAARPTFVYVSGAGTRRDSRMAWSRIKAATEDALAGMPLRAYAFRPGFIQPLHGITSRTRMYRVAYAMLAPVTPALRRLFPRSVTTTEQIGRAMLAVARDGYPQRVLESRDISALGAAVSGGGAALPGAR